MVLAVRGCSSPLLVVKRSLEAAVLLRVPPSSSIPRVGGCLRNHLSRLVRYLVLQSAPRLGVGDEGVDQLWASLPESPFVRRVGCSCPLVAALAHRQKLRGDVVLGHL